MIHLFNEYLQRSYCVPGTLLGPRHGTKQKTKNHVLVEFTFKWGICLLSSKQISKIYRMLVPQ